MEFFSDLSVYSASVIKKPIKDERNIITFDLVVFFDFVSTFSSRIHLRTVDTDFPKYTATSFTDRYSLGWFVDLMI